MSAALIPATASDLLPLSSGTGEGAFSSIFASSMGASFIIHLPSSCFCPWLEKRNNSKEKKTFGVGHSIHDVANPVAELGLGRAAERKYGPARLARLCELKLVDGCGVCSSGGE